MALSWALHDVCPSTLLPGDHIYRWSSLVHVHHGIVLEILDGSTDLFDRIIVLHASNGAVKVQRATLGAFLCKSKKRPDVNLKAVRYGVPPMEVWIKRSGTCYAEQSAPVDEVLARAHSLLEHEQPSLLGVFKDATSEDIAFWCKTGRCRAGSLSRSGPGGTNYTQGAQRHTSKNAGYAATDPSEIPIPQSISDTEAMAVPPALDVIEELYSSPRTRSVTDPDAFLLLQEGNEAQQTPQSVACIEVPTNDEDLNDYEVVDLPPWLPAEHFPRSVNVQA